MRNVRDGRIRGQIFLEGIRLSEEACRSGVQILDCLVSPQASDNERIDSLVRQLENNGVPIAETSSEILKSVADTVTPQGILAIAERPRQGRERIAACLDSEETLHVVCLLKIADPSNLGAIFRTAEAAGAAGVVISQGSADAFSPKVNRAALGANLRLPVWEGAETSEILGWAKDRRLTSRGADVSGELLHTAVDWTVPSLTVFGSEAHGLGPEVLSELDEVFRISMKNEVESLNLSVAAGIILFESLRQNS